MNTEKEIEEQINDTALVIAELATKIIVENKEIYMEDYYIAINKYVALICEEKIVHFRLRDQAHIPSDIKEYKLDLDNRVNFFMKSVPNMASIIEFANLVSKISNGFREETKTEANDLLTT